MNEKKKTMIIFAVIGLILLLVIGLVINNHMKSKKIYEQFEQTFYGEERSLIYIGRTGCSYCGFLNPSIEDMKTRYQLDYLYIDTTEVTNTHLDKIMEVLGLKELGTPYLVVVENGKIVDTQPEYVDYDKLFAFLQKNELIDKEAELPIHYIGVEEYQKVLADSKKSVIVVGQSTCHYCIQAKIILNQIADENDIDIYYLNATYFQNDEEQNKAFMESLDYLQQNQWGTPLMLVVQDGKLVNALGGLTSKEGYVSFLKEQGVL